jgi:predicted DNA-binding antitoxin AbrB/MazE fold protein
MSMQVEAVYQNGVFRPLQPVQLSENRHVTVTIEDETDSAVPADVQTQFVLTPERWQALCEALDAPPRKLPRLRKLLTEASLFDGQRTATP